MKSSKYAALKTIKIPTTGLKKFQTALTYTLPIYYGCSRIEDYFPKESIIQLDPQDKHKDLFLEILKSNIFQEKIEYIKEARNLVLDRTIFPFLESQLPHILREGYSDNKVNTNQF